MPPTSSNQILNNRIGKFRNVTGTARRNLLARKIKYLSSKDRIARQGKSNDYFTGRSLEDMPFKVGLLSCVHGFLAKPGLQVKVLEKGSGLGAFSSSLRNAIGKDGGRLEITSVSLTPGMSPNHRQDTTHARIGIGINMKFHGKFHLIVDFMGEDYHLPLKGLTAYSIFKSLSMLEKGGELFTVLPIKSGDPSTFSTHDINILTDEILLKGYDVDYAICTQENGKKFTIIHAKAII